MLRTFFALLVVAATADARTLYWRSLDVEAKLDRSGELRVSERHRMVFDGDWSGGERTFRVAPGQQFELISVTGGAGALLPTGGTIGLGQYSLSGTTLRWRARRPDDPPFRDQELTYVIDYKLRNIVGRRGDAYWLEHDFAFAERPGVIETFSLKLDLDPAWHPAPGFTPSIERANLRPGQSVIVEIPLMWTGEGQPQVRVVPSAAPFVLPWPNLAAFASFLAVVALIWVRFVLGESSIGRYAAVPEVTRVWLERNLLVHRAEVVGAAWDDRTGQAEVAALIAIMTGEGKIENQPAPQPRLRLLVPRESLSDYEREFVDRLFIAGDEIDPGTLRLHYHATGFDPALAISLPLHAAARALVGKRMPGASVAIGCAGVATMFGVLPIIAAIYGGESSFMAAVIGDFCFAVALAVAAAYRTSPGRVLGAAIALPLIAFAAAVFIARTSFAGCVTLLTANALMLWLALYTGRWKGTTEQLLNLRSFRAARDFLRRRLDQRDPSIEERWIPYILAFGLGSELDRWLVQAPRVETTSWEGTGDTLTHPTAGDFTPASSSAGPPAPLFVSGGGRFGGAGATGGWASSINTFAAAVPAPAPSGGDWGGSSDSTSSSSSSSSSGSSSSSRSSGGSRSGGGGGGGW